jgi:hypothetical protein
VVSANNGMCEIFLNKYETTFDLMRTQTFEEAYKITDQLVGGKIGI